MSNEPSMHVGKAKTEHATEHCRERWCGQNPPAPHPLSSEARPGSVVDLAARGELHEQNARAGGSGQRLPTWDEIVANALESLNVARNALGEARDWMNSDWAEGHGPANHEQRHKAAELIRQMKVQADPAKEALRRSTGATR